jgi:hypothetical protein
VWSKVDSISHGASIETSVASAVRPSVTTSFQKTVFWNLFEFSVAEITSKSISATF